MVKLSIGYPTAAEEQEILARRRERRQDAFDLHPMTDAAECWQCAAPSNPFTLTRYRSLYRRLTGATRHHRMVAVGASPRGALALLKLSRAWAALHGRSYVLPMTLKSLPARP